jgi:hypothetical protein
MTSAAGRRGLSSAAAVGYPILGNQAVEVTTMAAGSPVGIRIDFDEAGDISTVSTPARARLVTGTAVDTAWAGRVADYATIGGIRIPTRAEVGWELPDGPFVYWQSTITDIELHDDQIPEMSESLAGPNGCGNARQTSACPGRRSTARWRADRPAWVGALGPEEVACSGVY